MIIEITNTMARVTHASLDEREWLREYLSFPDPKARFRQSGNGRVQMYNIVLDEFPGGLLALVKHAAPKHGYTVEVFDKTTFVPPDPEADLAWLRPDQLEAVTKALNRRRGILHLPTSWGKGEAAVALARAVPQEWLFLVHRSTLADDIASRFMARNAAHGVDLGEVGRIYTGCWSEGSRLTCATFQSLAAALKKGDSRARTLLQRCQGLIVDEAHVLPADSYYSVAMMATKAAYRIGLSGTPLARGDRRSVLAIASLGPVIYRMGSQEVIARGDAAKPHIRMVEVDHSTSTTGSAAALAHGATYQGVYGNLVVRGKKRNATLIQIAKLAEKPGLLFVKEVRHGKLLEKALLNAGIRAGFVWGNHSPDYRKTMIDRLVRGDLDILVCSIIFQEGIDIPCLRSTINGVGGASVIAALQRLGRGMRVERDQTGAVIKFTFEMWDILDRGQEWLENHSKIRRRAYMKEGHTVEVLPPF